MKAPKISNFSPTQRQALIGNIKRNTLDNSDQEAMVELVEVYDILLEKLQSSKISINKLKEMLLGFKSEKLKELLQTH